VNKKSKYLLLAGTVIIWALVAVRIVNGLKKDDIKPISKKQAIQVNFEPENDSFTLMKNYPDPFLKNEESEIPAELEATTGTSFSATTINTKPEIIKSELPFDIRDLSYQGMITNSDNHKKIAMLKLKGEDYLIKEKELFKDVKVLKLMENMLILTYNGDRFEIKRSNGN
jgi:hypothetical protein